MASSNLRFLVSAVAIGFAIGPSQGCSWRGQSGVHHTLVLGIGLVSYKEDPGLSVQNLNLLGTTLDRTGVQAGAIFRHTVMINPNKANDLLLSVNASPPLPKREKVPLPKGIPPQTTSMSTERRRESAMYKRLFTCMLVLFAGCSTPRENILAGINQVIGLSLAQNQQSLSYEGKIGFTRSQAYSIPTGKTILESSETSGLYRKDDKADLIVEKGRYDPLTSTNPSITPELLSMVRVDAGVEEFLLGLHVSELFAVGKAAVQSPAAAALFVSQSKDKDVATEAAKAVSNTHRRLTKGGDPSKAFGLIQNIGSVLEGHIETSAEAKVIYGALQDLSKDLDRFPFDQFKAHSVSNGGTDTQVVEKHGTIPNT